MADTRTKGSKPIKRASAPIVNTNPRECLVKARINLCMYYPFFGHLAMKMPFFETKDIPTCAVDAKGRFYFNPEFVQTLTDKDAVFVVAHEVMHLVQRIHSRFPKGGNFRVWNLAGDQIINTMIVDSGLTMPHLLREMMTDLVMAHIRGEKPFDSNGDNTYMNTEKRYYELLKELDECPACKAGLPLPNVDGDEAQGGGGEKDQSEGDSEGEGSGGGGDTKKDQHSHGPNGEPCEHEGECGGGEGKPEHTCNNWCCSGTIVDISNADPQSLHEWEQNILSAAEVAKAKGSLPGYMKDFLGELTRPSVTWKDIVRAKATPAFRNRYTFQKPNRRESAIKARLPGRKPNNQSAVILIDTSGSISDGELIQFLSECAGIMDQCGCQELHIFFHDVAVYYHERFTKKTLNRVKVTRGGTSHSTVFASIEEELKKKPALVVAFTDLCTDFPEEHPKYPVVWAYTGQYGADMVVPFGKKVKVELTDRK